MVYVCCCVLLITCNVCIMVHVCYIILYSTNWTSMLVDNRIVTSNPETDIYSWVIPNQFNQSFHTESDEAGFV